MKIRTSLIALGIATLATGCQNLNTETLMQSGAQAFQAATLSNNDVKALSDKSCAEMDSKAQIAPPTAPMPSVSTKSLRRWATTSTAPRPTTRST